MPPSDNEAAHFMLSLIHISARIKNGAAASSYTATTVSFPVTLDVSYGTAEALELLIEYKEAQDVYKRQ